MGAPAIFGKQRGIKLLRSVSTLEARIQVLTLPPEYAQSTHDGCLTAIQRSELTRKVLPSTSEV
ncbi:MAG: hypothetical protein P8X89_16530 [Reinekea sp.]